jgi:hypothetical protein
MFCNFFFLTNNIINTDKPVIIIDNVIFDVILKIKIDKKRTTINNSSKKYNLTLLLFIVVLFLS